MEPLKTKIYRTPGMARRIAIAAVALLTLFFALDIRLRPVFFSMAEARARALAVQAINNAIYEIAGQGGMYGDLMRVVLDENDRVSMMSANTAHMNELSARTARLVQRNLGDIEAVPIPLGAALGLRLLQGASPDIQVRVLPVGDVQTEFVSEFSAAGINQTRHRISLKIDANVRMVIPTGSQLTAVSAQMPIAEAIVVGDVPEVFVSAGSLRELVGE